MTAKRIPIFCLDACLAGAPVWLGIVVLLIFPALGHCFSATAQVDQTRISSGDTLAFQVVVEGGKAEVDLSPLSDFSVLSSGTRTSRSYINGQQSHQVIYTYVLLPEKTGVLTIPPLTVTRDGEMVTTREIQILVSREKVSEQDQQALFAKAAVSSPDIVMGQQAVYTLRLFAAGNFSGASFTPPEFKGLTTRELTQWRKYTRNINGRAFVVNEIKFLIQGEAPGDVTISPAVFMVRKPVKGGRDPFGFDSFFDDSMFRAGRTKPVRVRSNPVTLKVNPLPPYTGAVPFSGLVGRFSISTALDKTRVKVGESVTLTVSIQGTGNIMDAGVPPLALDNDQFKVYQDSPVEEIRAGEAGFEGKKVFKQALVPNVPGNVTIPPITLSFFHTGEKTYQTVSTEPIPLEILPGEPVTLVQSGPAATGSNGEMPVGSSGEKQEVVLKNRDILDIREDISGIRTDTHLPLPWFIGLLLLPAVGFALSGLVTGIRSREKSTREILMAKARSHLKAAAKLPRDDPGVLNRLQAALTAAVLARGDRQAESLTREEARQILVRTGADDSLCTEVPALMDTMDAARFGGRNMSGEETGQYLARIKAIVKTLCLVLCLGAATLNLPSQAAAASAEPAGAVPAGAARTVSGAGDAAGLFIDSVRAYKSGEFRAAAQGFEAIAETGVKNPDLFYNTGNAWLKANDLGRAILWYERAKRLNPGDPDLNFNLAHARTLVRDKVDTALDIRDILFFWQGLVSLKTLQFMAIGGSVLFFTWAGIRQAGKKRIFTGAGMLLAALACALVLVAGLEAWRLGSDAGAVILKDRVAVRSGTLETATPLFDLHAGTRVRVLEKKENHLKIRFSKGRVGWVSLDEAQLI